MSKTRQARPPPVKATPAPANLPTISRSPTLPDIEPIPPLHHYMQRYVNSTVPTMKELPPLPTELPHPAPTTEEEPVKAPQTCNPYRASSIYSRPETSWEKSAWWDLREEEDKEDASVEDAFTLPATVYRDEASRKLEGTESPSRMHSPVIPEPSPSPVQEIPGPAREDLLTIASRFRSMSEEYDREWAPLPPTPQSTSQLVYDIPGELDLATSPPYTPDVEESADALQETPEGSTPDQSWYDDSVTESETNSARHTLASNPDGVLSTDSPPRGRTQHRRLPSYFHREQNYARDTHDKAIHLLPEPISHTLDAETRSVISEKGSTAPSHGTAKSEAVDMLKQRKAKTMSEAYHKLLIEQYQDLAIEGRAWEALADPLDVAAIDEEVNGQDVRLVPEPLFFPDKAHFNHNHEDAPYVYHRDARTRASSQVLPTTISKGGLSSFRAILPVKLRRNHSSTSGEIPISPPSDISGNGLSTTTSRQSSQEGRRRPWARKKSSQGHIPPLPLALPKSVANAPRRSREPSATRRPAPRRDSPHLYKTSEEVYPRAMERAPALPPTPETPGAPTFDILQAYAEPISPQTSPSSTGSGKSWSLLEKVVNKRLHPHSEQSGSGGSSGSSMGWYNRARDSLRASDKTKRQHDLKKSIRFVGQADPRNVETVDETRGD